MKVSRAPRWGTAVRIWDDDGSVGTEVDLTIAPARLSGIFYAYV